MRTIQHEILQELASRFGYNVGDLVHLGGGRGDSDGITYRATREGIPFVFKIIEANPQNPYAELMTNSRAAFFHYLGVNGVDTVSPVPNAQGNLTEMASTQDACNIAYTYPLLPGEHPDPHKWDEATLKAWGKVIGKTHRLTKAYPVWQGIDVPEGRLLYWREELINFHNICGDEDVKAAWLKMLEKAERLKQTRDTFGFVHNDPHMQNVLVYEGKVSLLDFDVANCHFFAADLAIAIQSVLFTLGGGIDRPVQNKKAIAFFTDALFAGYQEENDLIPEIKDAVNLFIDYRRLLLFTVMEEWLNSQPEVRAGWKALILDAPVILDR